VTSSARLPLRSRYPCSATGTISASIAGTVASRRFTVTQAARHDGSQLGAVLNPENTGSGVWADTAYRSKANLEALDRRGLRPEFQRAKPRGKPMPAHIERGNATRGRVCSISLARATARIALANIAYTMRRLVWIEGKAAPA